MAMLIHGTRVSGGVCSGPARLVVGVLDPVTVRPGEIIVASALTGDLLPLLAVAGAVIVEAPGALHSLAGTARLHGVPMVTGVLRAMQVIDEGDTVTVDGSGGVVLVRAGDGRVIPEPRGAPEVLFLCVHNAGRSQMAAAWCRRLGGAGVVVRSAGTAPADAVHPVVADAMREVGLDVSDVTPQLLRADAVRHADVVVTMGCGDECPYYPGTRYLDWALDDPAGQPLEVVRRIRDEIGERVRVLLEELGVASATAADVQASIDGAGGGRGNT